jgi:crotonobetainyl-CoA:carnitine CoA-transferase CaiB-like acyl-CoA transferase
VGTPARETPRPLDGWSVAIDSSAELPARICTRHLTLLGATGASSASRGAARADPRVAGALVVHRAAGADPLPCTIRWHPGTGDGDGTSPRHGSEAGIQADSGMMALHGADHGRPRRLGLDVASVAAGILAAQAVLAALLARSRGLAVPAVATSVLQGALVLLTHHVAIATCGDAFPVRLPPAPRRGSPFRTADGEWVELEALGGDAWLALWARLGVREPSIAASAWLPFVYRHLAGRCAVPDALHDATRRHTLAELRRAADECGIALCRVRTYAELLADDRTREPAGGADGGAGAPWAIEGTLGAASPPARRDAAPPAAPLAGLRVVEVTSRLQGPLAGLLLRQLGAEVVKVEPPGGDFGRHSPPLAGGTGAAYLAYNRGKQVVEIDYKRPDGRARLAALAADADVFLHNWPLGRAESLGLDAATLARANPRLVVAHASGWGPGPDEPTRVAGDQLVQAYAACGAGLNPVDEPPFPSRVTLVDATGGLLACEGVLAGLLLRERTGRGCAVHTSLLAGAMALQRHVLERAVPNDAEARHLLGRPVWGPLDRPVPTADGYLAVTVGDARTGRTLSHLCGVREAAHATEIEARIARRLHTRPAADWVRLLQAAGVPAAVVRDDVSTLPDDPRTARALECVDSSCWAPAPPWRLASCAPSEARSRYG